MWYSVRRVICTVCGTTYSVRRTLYVTYTVPPTYYLVFHAAVEFRLISDHTWTNYSYSPIGEGNIIFIYIYLCVNDVRVYVCICACVCVRLYVLSCGTRHVPRIVVSCLEMLEKNVDDYQIELRDKDKSIFGHEITTIM